MESFGLDAPLSVCELRTHLDSLEETAKSDGPVHIELDYYDIFNIIPDEVGVYPEELLKQQFRSIPNVHLIEYISADGSYALENGEIVKDGAR
jgi:hypothetical protein